MELNNEIITNQTEKPLVVGNSVFIPMTNHTLTLSDMKKAERDLGETDEKRESCLRKLKKKLTKDKIQYRMDDDYLLRYLRLRKFDCDKAYTSIKNLYSSRKRHPELFNIPSNLEYLLNTGIITCLPYADEEKNSVFLIKFENWNPEKVSFLEFLSTVFVVWDVISMNPHNQINGTKGIYDTKGFLTSHGTQFIRHSLTISPLMQEIYPWRVTKILFHNFHPVPRMIFKFVSHFLKKKIYDRIKVMGPDINELHQHVNPAILPEEYGGTLDTQDFNFTQYILDNLSYVKYERSFGCPLVD